MISMIDQDQHDSDRLDEIERKIKELEKRLPKK